MFTWTPVNVLVAIDAGIAEVISLYNANYRSSVTKLTGVTPKAHAYAMSLTVAALNAEERRIRHLSWMLDKALEAA